MLKKITAGFLVFLLSMTTAHAEEPTKEKLSPLTVEGTTAITHKEAKELFDRGVKFVDTRKDSDWESGRIPQSIHLELKTAFTKESLAKHVAPNDEVVFYCNGPKCLRSAEASVMALEWGYKKIYYYREGFPDWSAQHYPVE